MANWHQANPSPVPDVRKFQVTRCAARIPDDLILELRKYEAERNEAEFDALHRVV